MFPEALIAGLLPAVERGGDIDIFPLAIKPNGLRVWLFGGAFSRQIPAMRPPLSFNCISRIHYADRTALIECSPAPTAVGFPIGPTSGIAAHSRVAHHAFEQQRPSALVSIPFRDRRLAGAQAEFPLVVSYRHGSPVHS
jgi:hypothetical protein